MKKSLFIAILFFQYCIYGQIVIGNAIPSDKNILKIADGTRGVIFSHSDAHTSFPMYNASMSDLYDDSPNLSGGLIYNKNDDQYYKYDGHSWIPSRQIQGVFQPKASRLGVSSGTTIPCMSAVVGLCFVQNTPVYLAADNIKKLLIDKLTLKNPSTVTIKQSGIYEVGLSLGFTGGSFGAMIGIIEFKLTLQAKYTPASQWETVFTKSNYDLVFVIGAEQGKASSFTQTISLPAGAELRVVPEINSTAVAADLAAYGTDMNPASSYIVTRLIKAY